MNNKNLLIGAIALSNISLQAGYIDDEFTVQVGTNQALAQDMEIITVEGRRFTPPNYSTALQSSNVDYDSDQENEKGEKTKCVEIERGCVGFNLMVATPIIRPLLNQMVVRPNLQVSTFITSGMPYS